MAPPPARSTTWSRRSADTGISKSEVSRICADLDAEVAVIRDRSLADQGFPYVFLDATYCKVRVNHRVVSQAVVVEMIRVLRVARRGAMKAGIQAGAQIDAIIVSAPEQVRSQLRKLNPRQRIRVCAAFRPGSVGDPASATKAALRSLARRWQVLQAEIDDLDAELTPMVTSAAPALMALPGIGVDTAGQLLVTAGDNPHRLRTERSFARLCGVAPTPVSSGRTDRHRLHRTAATGWLTAPCGASPWCACTAISRPRTTRTAEGKTKAEILRCLKRYIAREAYPLLAVPIDPHRLHAPDDRRPRQKEG